MYEKEVVVTQSSQYINGGTWCMTEETEILQFKKNISPRKLMILTLGTKLLLLQSPNSTER